MAGTESTNTILDSGTYEIIRKRLEEQRLNLLERLAKLNSARKEIFNSTGFQLIGNQRITTVNSGVARGIMAFGNLTLFAYNVHFGLRENITLSDVFSIYKFTGDHFEPEPLTLIEDDNFITDFGNLYKYYRESIFARFVKTENHLYMVFQTSKSPDDRKAFKWLIKDDKLVYIDDRSVHEVKKAAQFEFNWIKSDLNNRRLGVHPHISILDKVFIEAVHGDITFKVENNTDSGQGIFSEPVVSKDQQLDDAEYHYADLGNLIPIKIKPYGEAFRAYIFNVRTKQVLPINSLLDAGVLLPDNQGIIFPNGYYLQNGEHKIFDLQVSELEFSNSIASPNGEDFLYVFYQKQLNTYVLMSYNMIAQQVETPIICNGFTVFHDGKLVYFKSENEAVRHHQVQIWQTPYTATLQENTAMTNNVLYKIGNKDIVSAMSESQEVIQLLQKEDSYEDLYEDIHKRTNDIVDSYFWLKDEGTFDLATPLTQIRNIANTAIDEFAKVQAQRQHAKDNLLAMQKRLDQLVIDIKGATITQLDQLVKLLAATRSMQGAVIDLQNIRYIDTKAVDALKEVLSQYNSALSQDTVQFLLKDEALAPYESQVAELKKRAGIVKKVIEAHPVEQTIKEISTGLEMLIDILNSLKIEDTTQTTRIVEKISLIFASLNEVKAELVRVTTALKAQESTGQFYAQLTLLDQSIVNFLDLSTSPEKCEEYFTKVGIQVEELESKFADFDEFILKIADKRDEVTKAFNSKKEMLIAQLNKRTTALEQIGLRVLKNIENKAQSFNDKESIYAFFSTDLMVDKVRNLMIELRELGDVAKAENLENLVKVSQETALRNLKDKTDLFVEGQNIIALGSYKFIVNKQVLDLTIVRKNEELFFHLIGTSFYKRVSAESLYQHKAIWEQELISENASIYRSEYLAYQTYLESLKQNDQWNAEAFLNDRTERDYAAAYLKGVHNTDAALIYQGLKTLQTELGILQYAPGVRVAAQLFWFGLEEGVRNKLQQLISAAYSIQESFPMSKRAGFIGDELSSQFRQSKVPYEYVDANDVAQYLYAELSIAKHFTCSQQAMHLKKAFDDYLHAQRKALVFSQEISNKEFHTGERFYIIQSWLHAFIQTQAVTADSLYVDETACMLLFKEHAYKERASADGIELTGMKGTHTVIEGEGKYVLKFHHFMSKLREYFSTIVPAFLSFNQLKEQLVRDYRQQLKIGELEPKVLSSFVRNRLINEVYFPLIGANLAKQIGAAGDDKRTARMGMLLLVSPPGYGKTTLMEYLAKTMGLHFVKINGPTIGHSITSIDPQEATTSGARAELTKINLSFEMADNVMLYLDDIQHCSPEFLQKFISLADGQRKMDGIFEGESKTYDLRGKRFCVVMAGNPYTESGEQFKIPDMLSNRADVYNLGDVIGSSEQLFRLSLIENCVAENRYLQRISNRSFDDLYKLITYVETKSELLPEVEGNYNQQEIDDAIAVLKNIMRIRDVVMQVNQQYIASAAMKDAYRTEPAFKLQGSYRNMNKMAGKIVPLMNADEVSTLILSHYEGESQTLTSDAEANLLRLKEIAGFLSEPEALRWKQIKEIFVKNNKFGMVAEGDTSGQMLVQLNSFNDHLEAIANAIKGEK
ncbi:DNA repair ATPase [Pseudochryseolinea flava]|uniref:AAA family ATPase n=1 Tax=Pseudochryseolinea flava TaxID=2059302 RepID=A0A364Y5N0_9BACT|nr:DNA repair ATPase [Pseudochryseolinea flava]RAW02142.1 AAA family ATPase [Pseudochryseolinea flava]